MSRRRQCGWLLLAGLGFGLLVAAIKGQDPGVRDALGNTSAPWVLVPFLAGTRYPQVWRATLVGLATTLAAFFGFYLAEAAILDLGPHPWYTDLQLTLGSGHVYEVWGVWSGALYGALGGLWASRSLIVAPLAVALAFVCEPLIVLFLVRSGIWGGGGLLHYHWLWLAEVIIGLAGIAFVVARAEPRSRTAN
jgi:Family of unknown function (DUF6518)